MCALSKLFSRPGENLIDHLNDVENGISRLGNRIDFTKFGISQKSGRRLLKAVGKYHDIGKATIDFQKKLKEKRTDPRLSSHAPLGACILYQDLNGCNKKLRYLAFQAVRHHHSNLQNPQYSTEPLSKSNGEIVDWQKIVNKQLKQIPRNDKEFLRQYNIPTSFDYDSINLPSFDNNIEIYILSNLIQSILIDADRTAASGIEIPDVLSVDGEVIKKFRRNRHWTITKPKNECLHKIKTNADFDNLRNHARNEISYLFPHQTGRIFLIPLPTGMGKTFNAFETAFKLVEKYNLERIIYGTPSTLTIDQNYEEINEMLTHEYDLDSRTLLKVHHRSDIEFEECEQSDLTERSISESYFLMEGFNTFITTTSLVRIFNTLFGWRNKDLRRFHKFANSVLILDEPQTIPAEHWRFVSEMLTLMAEKLNMYIILTSATPPPIFKKNSVLLLKNDYSKFVDRVKIINKRKEMCLDEFANFVLSKIKTRKKVMVILNTVKASEQFYQLIRNRVEDRDLFYISSYILSDEKTKRFEQVKKSKKYFLVTTQSVEAGTNIDAQLTFRDIAPFDSIVQAGGRTNRYYEHKQGKLYVVRLIDEHNNRYAQYIYDGELMRKTEQILNRYTYTESELYTSLEKYFSMVETLEDRYDEFCEYARNLIYRKKIDKRYIGMINFDLLKTHFGKIDVFITLNEEAEQTFDAWIELKKNKDKKVRYEKTLELKQKFYRYKISIWDHDFKKLKELADVNERDGIYYLSRKESDRIYDSDVGLAFLKKSSV